MEVLEYGLMLCTDSFTVQDIVRLMNVLIIRYNIISSIRSDVRKVSCANPDKGSDTKRG